MGIYFGDNNDNVFRGTSADDIFAGFGGFDTVLFGGRLADYSFDTLNNYLVVSDTKVPAGSDGWDRLVDIEHLSFRDAEIDVLRPGEWLVNTQQSLDQSRPVSAGLADGGFVMVWQSTGQDGSYNGIYAQRYLGNGQVAGPEFLVNSTTAGSQQAPAVAALADGGFVIAWESFDNANLNWNIHAQRFDARGVAAGDEMLVNASTGNDQVGAAVAALAGGGFVIAWQSWLQDGSGYGVYAQQFDVGGQPSGDEFRINGTTLDSQASPSLAGLPGGGFVATWVSWNQDGDASGIYARQFDADGTADGDEFLVNTTTSLWQQAPSVTASIDGGYLVAWQSYGQDGSGWGIFAQRYAADGSAAGNEFQVNGDSSGDQWDPTVGALADGGFALSWVSYDGEQWGIAARLFAADGSAAGDEFGANSTEAGYQQAPALATLGDGGFVVAWQSADASGQGIFAQRFDALGNDAPAIVLGTDTPDRFDLTGPGGAWIAGGAGNDTYYVDSANDRVFENPDEGIDVVWATASWTLGPNIERLRLDGDAAINGTGNAQDNRIVGNSADNYLHGAAGDDTIWGGGGNDSLNGGSGNDVLNGGRGEDHFVFDTPLSASGNVDSIRGFHSGEDVILLDDDVFTAFDATLDAGLQPGQFFARPGASAAHDADDRIIFDTATGALYYDADGKGGIDAVQFAWIESEGRSQLSSDDFLLLS